VAVIGSDEGYIEIILTQPGYNYDNGYNDVNILIYGTEVENLYTIHPWKIGERITIGKSSSLDYIVNGDPLDSGSYLVTVVILETSVFDGTIQI